MHRADPEVAAAAERLGISRTGVRYRIAKWGRERALHEPVAQGRPLALRRRGTARELQRAEADRRREEAQGAVLDALCDGRARGEARILRRIQSLVPVGPEVSRGRIIRALRDLVRDGRIETVESPDYTIGRVLYRLAQP